MTGYRFTLSCPQCGGRVEHVAGSRPSTITTEATAVAHCVACQRRWLVVLHLRPAPLEASLRRRGKRTWPRKVDA